MPFMDKYREGICRFVQVWEAIPLMAMVAIGALPTILCREYLSGIWPASRTARGAFEFNTTWWRIFEFDCFNYILQEGLEITVS
jgi:hypothetical protein